MIRGGNCTYEEPGPMANRYAEQMTARTTNGTIAARVRTRNLAADNPLRPRPSDERLAHRLNRYALGHSERATEVPSCVRFQSPSETCGTRSYDWQGVDKGAGVSVPLCTRVYRAYIHMLYILL